MVDWNLRSYSKDEFELAWKSSSSVASCAKKLGLVKTGGTHKSLKMAAEDLGLSKDHMKRYNSMGFYKKIPLEEILVEKSTYSSTSDLRKRLIDEGLLEDRCSAPHCPNPEHYPDPFTGERRKTKLTLDHINGNNVDNRIQNLRVLCYNCHSYTETFCMGNRETSVKVVCSCGNKKDKKAKMCSNCSKNKPTYLSNHSDSYLLDGITLLGWSEFSRRLGISDNGLRKEIDRRGLERPKLPRGSRKVRPVGFEPTVEINSSD